MTAGERAEIIKIAAFHPILRRPRYGLISECPVPILNRLAPMVLLTWWTDPEENLMCVTVAGRN